MVGVAIIFLYPLVFMLMSSLKPRIQILSDLRSLRGLLPVGDISLDNYRSVFGLENFLLYFRNSLVIAVVQVALSLLINSMAAFALSRLRWRGQGFVLAALIATLIIPGEAVVIPLLLLVSRLPWLEFGPDGFILARTWIDTLRVQIVPFLADVGSIFLFYQFFLDIPKELDEAAVIDGASPLQIYWRIILPLSGPVFATVAILRFLGSWNSYVWPVMTVQSPPIRPLMPAMQVFFGRTTEWGEVMAFATLVTIPVLAVFLLFQRWFIASVASTGSKD